MADYVLTSGTPFTTYNTASGNFTGNTSFGDTITISDNTGSDSEFDTSEFIQTTFAPSTVLGSMFLGSIEVGGVDYPILSLGNGLTYVFGVHLDSTSFPTVTSLSPDTSNFTVCFAAGTRIHTPTGETNVEELLIGDEILTADGRTIAVKWMGRQSKSKLFAGARMQPVRIHAGALGNGLPSSDLTVTGDHGMMLDGLVVNASALVNGTTIDWVAMADLPDHVTYYHIETEDHDVVLANGAPTETFVDALGRRAFDNHAEYLSLYGTERIIPELKHQRISSQRLLPETIRARLGIDANSLIEDMPKLTA